MVPRVSEHNGSFALATLTTFAISMVRHVRFSPIVPPHAAREIALRCVVVGPRSQHVLLRSCRGRPRKSLSSTACCATTAPARSKSFRKSRIRQGTMQTHHDTGVLWATHDGGDHGAGSIFPGEASLSRTGPVVHYQRPNIFVRHGCCVEMGKTGKNIMRRATCPCGQPRIVWGWRKAMQQCTKM